jgi:hypothetical protein
LVQFESHREVANFRSRLNDCSKPTPNVKHHFGDGNGDCLGDVGYSHCSFEKLDGRDSVDRPSVMYVILCVMHGSTCYTGLLPECIFVCRHHLCPVFFFLLG